MTRRFIALIVKPLLALTALATMATRHRGGRKAKEGGEAPASDSPLWRTAKHYATVAAVLLVLAGIGGVVVMVSGIVPIKASSGHWPITAWLLDFAKSRSVATYTLGVRAPSLEDPALVMKGAGHFDFGCRPCHGSPAFVQPRIAEAMTPRPPNLSTAVRDFAPEELFYIVKHGIKFSGMPAWPALERDDEVWAMVAFLRRIPDLDAGSYERLVETPPDAAAPMRDLGPQEIPGAIAASCRRCHGDTGRGRGLGAFPKLAAQRPTYLEASLRAYARGNRNSGIMEPIAAGLEDAEVQAIAAYYANLPAEPPPDADAAGDEEIALGESIATKGLPNQLVPPCAKCHGPGNDPRNPHYPRLEGQYASYLLLQLQLFKAEARGGTEYHHLMHRVAGQLEEEQMRAVARYYATR